MQLQGVRDRLAQAIMANELVWEVLKLKEEVHEGWLLSCIFGGQNDVEFTKGTHQGVWDRLPR